MIRKNGEYRLERRAVAGGAGELEFHYKATQEELFGKCRLCAEITLTPGQSIGEHAHDKEFELFYVLRGELVSIGADGTEEPFQEGDIMVTGSGETHALRNDSGKPATIFAIIVN